MKDVSFPFAFLAGLLSFFSPCVLPLVPVYISLITGLSIEELKGSPRISKIMGSTLAFVLGFSTIFLLIGAASSLLGSLLSQYKEYLRIAGGILSIIFGLFIAGFVRLDFLMREKRFHISKGPTGYVGAFLIGIGFAAGWIPCITPTLGTIAGVAMSHTSASYGLKLLSVYSLGFAIPFILSAFAINIFFTYTKKLYKYMRVIMIISGLVLIAFGVLLLADQIKYLTGLLPVVFPLTL
jgi:cytochrome c-type biogenesis protein